MSATSVSDGDHRLPCPALDEAADVVLSFGAALLRAGSTASRTHELVDELAHKLGFDTVSLSVSLDSITATLRRSRAAVTRLREIGPPGTNVLRIAALEQLANKAAPGVSLGEIATALEQIESATAAHSRAQLVAGIGVASGAFAFLNGAAAAEMLAAAVAGGTGQWLRSSLSRRLPNQYAVAALSSLAASGTYVLISALMAFMGFGFLHYPAGLIASVLFLVPGFPLIAGLFDLLRYETIAAVSRISYGLMMLLAVAFGLSIVITVADIEVSRQPPPELAYPLTLLLRATASFLAASAFALLFNSSRRTVLAAGLLGLIANDLRLLLIDFGMMPASAAYFAALTIGLVAVLADRRLKVPRVATTVAPTIIMVPGLYAFEMIVLMNRGAMLDALQAFAACGFIIGALAMGLATARCFGPR